MSIAFLPPRVPLVDPQTGLVTREWYRLFQSLFRDGGVPDTDSFQVAPMDSADQLTGMLQIVSDQAASAPTPTPVIILTDDVAPLVGAMRDEIAMLRREIDWLKQGTIA